MAFASVGSIGTGSEKTSDNSFAITTTATAEVGNVVVVLVAIDNITTDPGAASAETTDITVTDSAGNTYTRAVEFTNGNTTAGNSVTAGIFYSQLTSQLGSGGTITINLSGNATAKGASAHEFTKDSGTTLSVVGKVTQPTDSSADVAAYSNSGLASKEYLFVHVHGIEWTTASGTWGNDADYTDITGDGTSGGGNTTNIRVQGGFRIATLTGDEVDTSFDSSTDHAQALIALEEVAAGGGGGVGDGLIKGILLKRPSLAA